MHTVAGILIKGKQTYKVVTRNNWIQLSDQRQVTDSKGQECTNNPSSEVVFNNPEELGKIMYRIQPELCWDKPHSRTDLSLLVTDPVPYSVPCC